MAFFLSAALAILARAGRGAPDRLVPFLLSLGEQTSNIDTYVPVQYFALCQLIPRKEFSSHNIGFHLLASKQAS